MARTTRRDLLGAGGFTALAGIAAVAIAKPDAQTVEVLPTAPGHGGDDAKLVALCSQFMALQAQLVAMGAATVPVRTDGPEHGPGRDGVIDGLTDRQADILDKMHDLTATTLAGHRARAMAFDKWCSRGEHGDFDIVVSWGDIGPLIRDLVGGSV